MIFYFSGTGTTEKVATTLAKDLAERLGAGYDTYCFNLPQAREKDLSFGPEDLVVLGTPVYAGLCSAAAGFRAAGTPTLS